MRKFWFLAVAIAFLVVLWVPYLQATPFTLTDENSTAEIDTEDSSGMWDWTVDGTSHLFEQWFYYRIGETDPTNTPAVPISALTIGTEIATDTNGSGSFNNLFVRYLGTGFNIEVNFTLDGAQTGTDASDIAEQISINNTGSGSLEFHFFQYTDFDLSGTSSDDTVEHLNNVHFRQYDPAYVSGEVVSIQIPSHWQAGAYPSVLDRITDGYDLLDAGAPYTGDATFAWQWDANIAAGGTYQISKDKNIHPQISEPSILLLLGSGLVGVSAFARLKKRKKTF